MDTVAELPRDRRATSHDFTIGEVSGTITVDFSDAGFPVKFYARVDKVGNTVSGLVDAIAVSISLLLQHGVPIAAIAAQLKNTRFEPSGMTRNPSIPTATSLADYFGRYLEHVSLLSDALSTSNEGLPSGIGCPECGKVLVNEKGCLTCKDCGYTKCS